MVDKSKNDNQIRRIIDPKSGFSLYIRKFSDSEISQVSTDKTFPIPDPNHIQVNQQHTDLIESINELSNKNTESLNQNKKLQRFILKQNQQMKILTIALIVITAFGILF